MRKRLTLLALPTLLLLLAGCGFVPLPKEERYAEIYKALNLLEYTNAGEIISEEKDNGDGVSSSSSIIVKIKGENSYEFLTKKLKTVFPTITCRKNLPTQTKCSYGGGLSFTVAKENETSPNTTIFISDIYSGKKQYNEK